MTWVMLRDRCDRTLLRRDPRRCPQSQENSDENIQRPRYHEEEMENHGASSYQVLPSFSMFFPDSNPPPRLLHLLDNGIRESASCS